MKRTYENIEETIRKDKKLKNTFRSLHMIYFNHKKFYIYSLQSTLNFTFTSELSIKYNIKNLKCFLKILMELDFYKRESELLKKE